MKVTIYLLILIGVIRLIVLRALCQCCSLVSASTCGSWTKKTVLRESKRERPLEF